MPSRRVTRHERYLDGTRAWSTLVLATLTAVAMLTLGGGVATADGVGAPSDKDSSSTASQPDAHGPTVRADKKDKDDKKGAADAPKTAGVKTADVKTADSTSGKVGKTADAKTAATTLPSPQKDIADPAPRTPDPSASHTAAALKTSPVVTKSKTSSAPFQPLAAVTSTQVPSVATPTVPMSGPPSLGYLANSTVNALGTTAASIVTPLGPNAVSQVEQTTQWIRQMVGLGFDIGAMTASLVNNLALMGAHAIGPVPLWGLPFNGLNMIATAAGDVSKMFTGTPLNAAGSGPFPVDYGVYNLLGYLNPQAAPPGANDPSITVTKTHPLPVILVNATAANQNFDWSVGAPVLANAGYKVYTFNYGNNTSDPNFPMQSTGDIAASAVQLSGEVDKVLAETHAPQVILIGHSQGGGIMPEYYLNNLGGASKVSQFIGIAPSNHGTTVDGLTGLLAIPVLGSMLTSLIGVAGAAWTQQALGSSMVQQVYGNGDTRPGVIYDTIATMTDWVVTPYTQSALNGPNVTNVVIQQQDPGFAGGHLNIAVNYQVWQDILSMLAANPAASPQPVAAVA